MSFDYNKARATAKKLIEKFGQTGEVVKINNSPFDSSGNPTSGEPTFVANGIVTPLLKYKQAEIDGESVLSTDSFVFFHSSTTPEVGMMITINSQQFRVIDLKTLDSVDDINIYRKLQLRK